MDGTDKKERIIRFILNRLQVVSTEDGAKLVLQKLSHDTYDSLLSNSTLILPKQVRTRRTTFDDVKTLQNQLAQETEQLKTTVVLANEKSRHMSVTLDSFQDIKKKQYHRGTPDSWKTCLYKNRNHDNGGNETQQQLKTS